MSERKLRSAKAKLIMGISIPLLVMVITATMVGVSFAWFSQNATVEIASINLTTAPVFTLTFTADNISTTPYAGQLAFDGEGHLITTDWASDPNGRGLTTGTTDYDNYLKDAPFSCSAIVKLDTEGKDVTLDVSISDMLISVKEGDGESATTEVRKHLGSSDSTQGDICYGFTWYMISGGTVYTPYGTFASGTSYPWETLPERTGLENFNATNGEYTFYIVFAPEKLYWLQYVQPPTHSATVADRTNTIYDSVVYDDTEREKIVDSANDYGRQLYYSSPLYIGVDFSFAVTLEVTQINEETGGETA